MLHYYPRHVSSINMPIFSRTNCILTASGIVALCKRLHSTPVKSGLHGQKNITLHCDVLPVWNKKSYSFVLCRSPSIIHV